MNIVSNAEMCLAFRRLADWTWQNMGDAHRLKVSLNEETITEYILLQLARQFSGRGLEIESYTKQQEGKSYKGGPPTAADWAFWFEDISGRGLQVRIQAKRLFPQTGQYESLNGDGDQITKLVQNANGAIPLYVLYNCGSAGAAGSPASILPQDVWPFCGWPFFFNELWGCSVATPTAIPKKNKPSPAEVKQLPWHVLVCGCLFDSPSGPIGSLPELLAANLRRLYQIDLADRSRDVDSTLRYPSLTDLNFELTDDRPSWVNAFRDSKESIDWPKGVGGVAVFTDKREGKR